MKIAIFTDTLFPEQVNGVARVASRSAAKLSERGHDVRVWSVGNVPSVPFWGYPGEYLALPTGKAFREVKAFRPDIIHTHTPFGLGWEAVATAKFLNIPLVGTHHTFFDHYLKHINLDFSLMKKISWKYLILHYNRYDIVLSPSQALLGEMQRHGLKRKTLSFPNGIDTDFFTPPQNKQGDGMSLIYMGRVSYEKSIDQVIRAFKLINTELPESTLTIVGPGPERKKLESLVQSLGLSKKVFFTGTLHGEAHLKALQAADIFLTASKTDNMPLAVIEAMAVGLPIIGVDALGIPEIVKDGQNGYIVPVDNPEAIAKKTVELLQNNALRTKFSRASRELALEYGEEKNIEALEKIYNSLIQRT
jgi:glycosyltransferase involved in cell wall biosynthesis